MKILLDENMPHDLRPMLMPRHEVYTVQYLKWSGMTNGKLLKRAADAGFEFLITVDGGIEYQQNAATLPVGVMVLHFPRNDRKALMALVPEIMLTLETVLPRTVVHVPTTSTTAPST